MRDQGKGGSPEGCPRILSFFKFTPPAPQVGRRVVRRVVRRRSEAHHLTRTSRRPHPQDDVVVRVPRVRHSGLGTDRMPGMHAPPAVLLNCVPI